MIWYPERGSLWAPPSGVQRGHIEGEGKKEGKKTGAERTERDAKNLAWSHDCRIFSFNHRFFLGCVCVFFLDAAQFNSEIFGRMFYIQPVFLGFTGKKTFQELIVFPQKDSKNGVRTETGKETRDKTKTFIIKWQIFDWLSNSKMGWIMISTVKMLV